jgi:hypothetical protein
MIGFVHQKALCGSSDEEWFAMLDDCRENVVGACWITNEEPKIAILIIDGKLVAAEPEVEPHLRYVIGEVIRDLCSGQMRNVPAELLPFTGLGKVRKMAGAVMRPEIKKLGFHESGRSRDVASRFDSTSQQGHFSR